MDENQLIQQVLKTWQSMASQGAWHQDAFLFGMCLIVVIMLFMSGTMLGLFVQSLWGILITSQNPAESEN